MLTFLTYLQERDTGVNIHNTAYGDAYETATVLHLHNHTAARNNKDPEYQAKIEAVRKKHNEAMEVLPHHKQAQALQAAAHSGDAYLKSLKDNHGKSPNEIHEVHHTSGGIDKHIGRKVDRAGNPHDLIVKGKGGFMHGTSLKATSGTASNNTVKAFDTKAGLKTNLEHIWKKGAHDVGLSGKSTKERKAVRHEPEVVAANKKVQGEAAQHHADVFNKASHEEKQKHLHYLLKSTPDLPYDYVKGEKGGSATPHHELPHIKAINNAKKINATVSSNFVRFHDEHGNHIATVEHRPTHGSFVSPSANAKFGSMK
jgi:hypothetical protein